LWSPVDFILGYLRQKEHPQARREQSRSRPQARSSFRKMPIQKGKKKKTPKKAKSNPAGSPNPKSQPKTMTTATEVAKALNESSLNDPPTLGSEEGTPTGSQKSSGSEDDSNSDLDLSLDGEPPEKKKKERKTKEKEKKEKAAEEKEEDIEVSSGEEKTEGVVVVSEEVRWADWEEDYLREVEEERGEEFFTGRRKYMELSGEAARASAMAAEKKWKAFFDENKGDESFQDGVLVGALYFYQGAPAIHLVQVALHNIGLKGQITPLTKTTSETKNYEVRGWNKRSVEHIHATIGKLGADVAKAVGKPFRWKELRHIEEVVIKISGLPFQWGEKEVRKGLFMVGGFPTTGLIKITRILFQGKDSGEVHLIYKFLPERLIGWGRLGKNDFTCSRNKKAHWRILRPPREFEDFQECKHCMWTHGTRTPCEVKIWVDREGWEAAAEIAKWKEPTSTEEEKEKKEETAEGTPYTKDPFWDTDFPVEDSGYQRGAGGRGGGVGRGGGAAWGRGGTYKQ
jgi:hypothetical protein